MFRPLLTLAVTSTAVLLSSPHSAIAQPGGDVPGMEFNVVKGQPCSERSKYVYGRDAAGELLACHGSADPVFRWDGPLTGPLMGVQTVGTACAMWGAGGISYAQSPDGYPLSCASGEWGRI